MQAPIGIGIGMSIGRSPFHVDSVANVSYIANATTYVIRYSRTGMGWLSQ